MKKKKQSVFLIVFLFLLFGLIMILLGITLGINSVEKNLPEPENILGVATEMGCYKTIYSDKDLVREYWFLTEMNQEPLHLCILPQNFSGEQQ